jgi:hypothetical protein
MDLHTYFLVSRTFWEPEFGFPGCASWNLALFSCVSRFLDAEGPGWYCSQLIVKPLAYLVWDHVCQCP